MNNERIVKEVSMAKYYCCELAFRTATRCLQLFGGYGFCKEYPISQMFVDSRVDSIFAGTSEIMLTIIAREMGL
jgi:acyl-CoA dehydrogenase